MVEVPIELVWIALGLLAISCLVAYLAIRSRRKLKERLSKARSRKRSQSTRYGQLTQQFAPWMDTWPFDPERFRFLGDPIDGVQFTKDAVYLVEIKAAGSRTTKDQRRIRELVEQGRIGWIEFRIDGDRDDEILEPWRRRSRL